MPAWAGAGNRISLDKLCKALGLPGKADDIDGSKVWDFVKAGRIAEVAEYCKDDVRKARACHERIVFMPGLIAVQEAPAPVAPNIPAQAPNIAPAPANISDDGKTITLGNINGRLSVVSVSREILSRLGFEPVGKERTAILYLASDLRAICNAIAAHVLAQADHVEQEAA